jgi:hypothetical protein
MKEEKVNFLRIGLEASMNWVTLSPSFGEFGLDMVELIWEEMIKLLDRGSDSPHKLRGVCGCRCCFFVRSSLRHFSLLVLGDLQGGDITPFFMSPEIPKIPGSFRMGSFSWAA